MTIFSFVFELISKEQFLNDYFDRAPLHIKGSREKFSDLFDMQAFNQILNSNTLLYPKVRITNHNNTIHKYDLIDDVDRYSNNQNNTLNKQKMLHAIARGGTLVFDNIQQHSPRLEDFSDKLAEELSTRVSINGYYTAAHQAGVNPHFDRHDVLVLQTHGSKRWYYRSDQHVLSKAIRHQTVPLIDADATGWSSVLLEQGDVFYCPRGVWHFTRTEAQHSGHLAVGLYPLTLKDWLLRQEQDENFASLLESYVRQPFQNPVSLIETAPLLSLVNHLLNTAQKDFDLELQSRPYLELE
ncbi:cupin domain-containing protein [Pseudomonas capsici]|uniref:cupin domain-containing protein n=1 Tax=Pseudomonas capsici TaxID=2810614 RepID=UPI0021F1FCEC|nr:cupin domain-containing protein [Pseudomonas capsici]MCV4285127.1 cupin domain-containing protein [Pseudomonas capsici]